MSLVELPRFSFGVTLYEYLNLMALPGLESFVHYFIRDILLRPYVLPESITVPLAVRAGGHLNCWGLMCPCMLSRLCCEGVGSICLPICHCMMESAAERPSRQECLACSGDHVAVSRTMSRLCRM